MTKNKTLAIIVFALLILLSLGFYIVTKSSTSKESIKKPGENELTTQQEETKTEKQEIKGSLFDLIGLNKTLKCSYSSDTYKMRGESYISGKNVRTNASIDVNGQAMDTYMITDGTWLYSWTSASKMGTKMNLEELKKSMETPTTTPAEDAIPNAQTEKNYEAYKNEFNYDCNTWLADNSVFAIPSDITFTDLGQTLNNLMPKNSNAKESACKACDMINDEASKTQCKKQLGC
ncbi:MAG: hypothetical protein AAB443_00440 [Patescibacteria group bacterium]